MVKVVGTPRVGAGASVVGAEVSAMVEGHWAEPEQEIVSVAVAIAVVVSSVGGSVEDGHGTDSVTETGTVVVAVVSSVGASVEDGNGSDSVLVADAVPVMTMVGRGGRVIVTRVTEPVGVTTGGAETGRGPQGEVVAVQVSVHSMSVTVTVSQSVSAD